ncbi:MAG: antitoxin MazE-like protein [Deltaproteobacteria bacterium]
MLTAGSCEQKGCARPIQNWEPDVRSATFAAEAGRQSRTAIRQHDVQRLKWNDDRPGGRWAQQNSNLRSSDS